MTTKQVPTFGQTKRVIMRLFLLKISVSLLCLTAGCGSDKGDAAGEAPRLRRDLVANKENPQTTEETSAETEHRDTDTPRQVGADALAYFGDIGIPKLDDGTDILKEDQTPQSVVLIVIDTLNARHTSAYGYKRATTRSIARLAAKGILFSNYVSNSSWTRPSYTTIITGLPKSKHQVELGGSGLPMEITSLAERFLAAGYRTAAFVGNPLMREIWGFGQGYQTYRDTAHYKKGFPYDGRLVDDAIEWLKQVGNQKHFTTLFLTSPHAPYRPPRQRRRFLAKVKQGPVTEYPFREYPRPLARDVQARIVAAYDDEVAYSDHQVGRILDYLKKSGRANHTTVVVTSDHGEMLGAHNCYGHAYHMWEGTLRVPLVISSSNLSVSNRRDDSPHTHIDLAPSLLQLAGIPVPSDLPGISLFDTTQAENRRIRMSQYNAHGIRRQAFRDNRYKIVHYHKINDTVFNKLNSLVGQIPHADPRDLPSLVASLKGERYALYDMVADPEETTDRFEQLKDEAAVKRLLEALLSHLKEKSETVGKMSDELIQALRNAGYFITDEE